jgi:hypothetical protein
VDELAGVIAANLMTAAPASPALRRWQDTPEGAEWRALEAKLSRRIETVADISDDDAAYIAAEAEIHAEQDRLAAYVQHIWAMRPKNADDAVLQVLTRSAIVEHYSEQTDGFDGTRLTLDYLNPAELARNGRPAVCDDSAFAHLLDAIRQLEDLWIATGDIGMRAAISPPVAPFNAVRDSYLASDWNRIVTAFLAETSRPENNGDAQRDGLTDRLCEATNRIWARPVRSWDELVERAAMAVHWNQDDEHIAYPDDVIASDDEFDFDMRALAHVVRGILDLAGLQFDVEGRLI